MHPHAAAILSSVRAALTDPPPGKTITSIAREIGASQSSVRALALGETADPKLSLVIAAGTAAGLGTLTWDHHTAQERV